MKMDINVICRDNDDAVHESWSSSDDTLLATLRKRKRHQTPVVPQIQEVTFVVPSESTIAPEIIVSTHQLELMIFVMNMCYNCILWPYPFGFISSPRLSSVNAIHTDWTPIVTSVKKLTYIDNFTFQFIMDNFY